MIARRLALATAALTAGLMVLGGVVHATESSLACPDWPTCHGEWMPAMVGGVLFEHSHRMLGALVGLFTLALAVSVWRRGGSARAAGLGAIALVIAQGILGGLTVILELPPPVSTAHLATAFTFLALLLWLARRGLPTIEAPEPVARHAGLAALLVFAQSVVGALVRHNDAGTACGVDPILCAGQWAPAWDLGRLQMFHRAAAALVAIVVVLACAAALRSAACRPLRGLALAGLALVVAQIALGVLSVTTALDPWMVTLHLACAVALFAAMLWIRLGVHYAGEVREPSEAPSARSIPA